MVGDVEIVTVLRVKNGNWSEEEVVAMIKLTPQASIYSNSHMQKCVVFEGLWKRADLPTPEGKIFEIGYLPFGDLNIPFCLWSQTLASFK